MINLAWGGYKNGRIPSWAMVAVSGFLFHPVAAIQWKRMAYAFKKATGRTLGVTESYRNYTRQLMLWNLRQSGQYPYPVAYPGTSNHGWARAVDLNGYLYVGSYPWRWLIANAPKYGWTWTTGKASGEPWHWEYTGSTTLLGLIIKRLERDTDMASPTGISLFYDKTLRVGYLRDLNVPAPRIRCLGLVTQANYKIESNGAGGGYGISTAQVRAQVDHHGIRPETAEYIEWLGLPAGSVTPPTVG